DGKLPLGVRKAKPGSFSPRNENGADSTGAKQVFPCFSRGDPRWGRLLSGPRSSDQFRRRPGPERLLRGRLTSRLVTSRQRRQLREVDFGKLLQQGLLLRRRELVPEA